MSEAEAKSRMVMRHENGKEVFHIFLITEAHDDSPSCECGPVLDFRSPDAEVWVHRCREERMC